MVDDATEYSCSAKKKCVHRICPMMSLISMSSASVELFEFSFCFVEVLKIDPFPSVIVAPECPLMFEWIAYDASTYHLVELNLSIDNVSTKSIIEFTALAHK